ncbi:hypothetical protein DYBT9623_01505 [Dyadobacter sp. CECT 9623]|uniref:Uncharacterized protein n=1 Tax=Dyadobacter linearis TaxID=2823330 RepID=A0ABN7R481_9BACT|nr:MULTISPECIES: hypothetical protein [unclassified Dyadobacter]MCE7060013.1 hypothetical protein [Dyadobacter sp. CY343]CAG5068773.1 hypothetical protein DYBT9623_01505 [Dyadobacter sp. CECT 9623]
MANQKTVIDQWSVKDLEDNTAINVTVEHNTELGNAGLPGIQFLSMGQFVTFEPNIVEQWAYQAGKLGTEAYYLEDKSWARSEEEYIKYYLLTGSPLKARITVKTRSSKPVTKEYELPF